MPPAAAIVRADNGATHQRAPAAAAPLRRRPADRAGPRGAGGGPEPRRARRAARRHPGACADGGHAGTGADADSHALGRSGRPGRPRRDHGRPRRDAGRRNRAGCGRPGRGRGGRGARPRAAGRSPTQADPENITAVRAAVLEGGQALAGTRRATARRWRQPLRHRRSPRTPTSPPAAAGSGSCWSCSASPPSGVRAGGVPVGEPAPGGALERVRLELAGVSVACLLVLLMVLAGIV